VRAKVCKHKAAAGCVGGWQARQTRATWVWGWLASALDKSHMGYSGGSMRF